jgi:WD40 repeat protein
MSVGAASGSSENPFVGPRPFQMGEALYGRDREVRELVDLLVADRIVLLYSPSGAGKTSLIQSRLIPALRDQEGFVVLPGTREVPVIRVGQEPDGDADEPGNRYVASTIHYLEKVLAPAGAADRGGGDGPGAPTLAEYFRRKAQDGLLGGFDLRLMPPLNDVSGIPIAGETLVVVAAVKGVLHFRIFDGHGTAVVDTDETRLAEQPRQIEDLRKQLESLWPPHEPTRGDKDQVITAVTSIVSQGPILLVFDQFEEVLTSDPTDLPAKDEFFAQLGDLLRDRNRWALFSMREDFVPALDPYLRRIPRQFGSRYRLDLLTKEAALEAIIEPSRGTGAEFTPEAAGRLVDELSRVRVQQGGTVEWKVGPYIEPVQLQVVCLRLWEKDREAGAHQIECPPQGAGHKAGAVTVRADVDGALGEYYAEKVHAVHADTGVRERDIRDWLETHLITSQGIRNQVPADSGAAEDLPPEALRKLVDAYIVRAESRRGVIWYELAHDRLVEPIRKDNARWRETALSVLQRQAALWVEKEEQDGFLLHDQALTEAERWAAEHPEEVGPTEERFLKECADARTRAQKEARKNRLIAFLAAVAGAISVVALGALLVALYYSRVEKEQARLATARELAAKAVKYLRGDPEQSLRLARESVSMTYDANGYVTEEAAEALQQAVHGFRTRWSVTLRDKANRPTKLFDVAFSPDGHLALVACEDGIARVWDTVAPPAADRPVAVIAGAERSPPPVFAVAFSPDGRRAATGGLDGAVKLWDAATGRHQAELRPAAGVPAAVLPAAVLSVAFRPPDGRSLAACYADGAVRLWDADSRRQQADLRSPEGPTGAVYSVAFSHDGSRLAAAGFDKSTRVWDIPPGGFGGGEAPRPSNILRGHTDEVFAVAFSPDGRRLATASRDRMVKVWDPATGYPASTITGHTDTVFSVAFSPDGERLCTASADGTSRCWEARTGRELFTLAGHAQPVSRVVFSRDGRRAATTGWDGALKVGDANFLGHTELVSSVDVSGDGKYLASASYDRTAKVWEAGSRNALATLTGHHGEVSGVAFRPDTGQVATACWDGVTRLWDWKAQAVVREFRGHKDQVYSVAFAHDGKTMATAGRDRTVILWDPETGKPLRAPLTGHAADVSSVRFSAQGDLLATASADGTVRVWDVRSGAEVGRFLSGTGSPVRDVAFSPDGRRLAMAGMDELVTVWDIASNSYVYTLPARPDQPRHRRPVNGVVYRRDGTRLATVGDDGVAIVWNTITPGAVLILYGHSGPVYSAAFTPDGSRLVTAGADGKILVNFLDVYELYRYSTTLLESLR